MAARGVIDDDDTSISVLSDPSAAQHNSDPGGNHNNIPEFHMYTGSYESDASHYALSLSHRALQKKNRDLEQQVHRLQRDNSKLIKSTKVARKGSSTSLTASEEDSSSSSSISPRMYRSRSVVQDVPSREAHATEDFIAHIQNKLDKSEAEKRELSQQLEEMRMRCQTCEQRRRDISLELDQALEIAASRLEELEATRQDLEYQRARTDKLQAMSGSADTLQRRLKDTEVKLSQAQRENASMQQLYEESANKEGVLRRTLTETHEQVIQLKQELLHKDTAIDRQKHAISEFHATRERLEEMNKSLRSQLDRNGTRQNSSTEEENDSFLLEETREVILQLQARILGMQDVIRKQTDIIKDLVRRIQQRAQGPTPSLRSVSPSNGMMPKRPITMTIGDEDLSLEEPRTMVGANEEDTDQTPLMRVDLPQNPQRNNPTVSRPPSQHSPLSGIVANGERTPLFNFSTQAVINTARGNHGNHTEPIVRHPPPISGQRPVTAPISQPRHNVIGNLVTVETNGVADSNNLYTRTRVPVEQSDHVTDTTSSSSSSPKECPICNHRFPQLSQEAFELHVNHCLTKAESSPTTTTTPPVATATPSPTRETPQEIYECPVCNQIYAPGTPKEEFENHVDSHFVEENFEMLSRQPRH